jgi:conjugal transfer pilus assembly protein TraF
MTCTANDLRAARPMKAAPPLRPLACARAACVIALPLISPTLPRLSALKEGMSRIRKTIMLRLLIVAAALLAAAPALVAAQTVEPGDDALERAQVSDDFYCGERKLGQWFYCAKPKPKEQAPGASASQQSAVERMRAITQQLDELKARAILEPSEANVIAYVRFQREQLDRASTFSDTWQRALWQNPDLDYTLQRPVSTVGKRAWLDNRRADRDAVLTNLGQRYGLFYFFAQSCGACELFSPILRSVADSHRLAVMAVSMDGGPSRDFPNYVVDAGQRARMGVPGNETPALVLFDTATKRTIPVGYGILSADEIMDRIFALTNTKVGSDY